MAGQLSGFTEAILLSLAFVAILGVVVAGFNYQYDKDYSVGLNDNVTENLFITYQDTAQNQIEGGEATFDASQGITLKSSWGLTKDIVTIVFGFITGGWIENIASMMGLGASGMILARALRILYFISLIFGLLYILFKTFL